MAECKSIHSIQGSWKGSYYHDGEGAPHGFEAVFVECTGKIDGNILDHGELGEAMAIGTFSFPCINFTKVYQRKGTKPVNYRGTMSEDGKTMFGTWCLSYTKYYGTWIASRLDDSQELKFTEKHELCEEDRPEILATL